MIAPASCLGRSTRRLVGGVAGDCAARGHVEPARGGAGKRTAGTGRTTDDLDWSGSPRRPPERPHLPVAVGSVVLAADYFEERWDPSMVRLQPA